MKRSLSANAIHGAYIDEATKRAMLGAGAAASFGLPLSAFAVFKASALEDGPVILVPAVTGSMILPFAVICFVGEKLDADVSANFGWPAPEPKEGEEPSTEHDEPWLNATPVLFYGGEDQGSLVTLPNATVQPAGRVWPECVIDRPFAVQLATPAARGAKKGRSAKEEVEKDEREASARAGEEPTPVVEPDLSIVVFYTAA